MMSGQARSSVTIMGLDTHMILETVPVPRSPRRTAHHAINRSSRHGVGGAFLVEVILDNFRALSLRVRSQKCLDHWCQLGCLVDQAEVAALEDVQTRTADQPVHQMARAP